MPPRDYQPGEPIPGTVYQVIRLIGVGGMGTVYDVEDTTIGKRYVLKTLHPKLGAREDLARRVQNEARTLARLNHPNIVDVITAGVTADDLRLPYYVMERLNGQSLRVVLEKKGQLELAHAYHIGIDLLDALDHAHDKGLIHRDVKPDNIFLHRTAAGLTVTKLLDFGIVSVLDSGSRETAGRFLGTLRYAAPEQLRGEKPTPKMDVYAAGLVIYEIVAGRGPFDDEGDSNRIGAAHMNKPPPRVSRFATVPKELDSLLMAALAKDPEARPRDAFSFAASLRNLKRLLDSARQQDATGSRATAPAVVGTDPGAITETPPVPSPESAPPTSLPKTTLPGMAAPTVGPALATTSSLAATATTPESVDRTAPTGSVAADETPAPRSPRNSTEALSGGMASLLAATTVDAATIPSDRPPTSSTPKWPAERAMVPSDEPQVRSLPAPPPLRASSRPAVAAIVGACSLLALAGLALVFRHGGTESSSAPATMIQLPPPRPGVPVVDIPAPILAPPAFDDLNPPEAGAASASAGPEAPAAPTTVTPEASASASAEALHPAPKRIMAPLSAKPAPQRYAPDRPGPGF
jgi:serine/threonine protein kinase